MKKIKFLLRSLALIIVIICASNIIVITSSRGQTYNTIEDIPYNKVGLVLGAGKYTKSGHINTYYAYRIDAAVELYLSGKVDFLLVSGDNGRKEYDEPSTFKTDLINRGIPAEKIILDYAGFRTLDSVIRAKEIFGQESITIISQKFHNERAIYIANNKDIDAIAFNARDGYHHSNSLTKFREYLARTKATTDILFNVQPKFLGAKITIQ